jgi:hypothetical protein
MTPPREVRPTVGLIPTTPLARAGPMILVSVSVPKASGTMFVETETALPLLEPSKNLHFS